MNNRNLDLELNEEKCLCLSTAEAGPGEIHAEIIAPNNEKLPINKLTQNNLHKIYFNPAYEGEYKINLWLNNYHLSFSPIIARTWGYSILNEIRAYGNGLCKAELDRETEFFVDCSRIKNLDEHPEISFMGFSSDLNDLKINVVKIEESIYKCTYTPEKPGHYLINIKFNRAHVSGSPFEVKIGLDSNPSKIQINKEDFRYGILGQELTTIIDTRYAGPGELTAYCMGSNKSALCEFQDLKDGTYILRIKPQETGKHILQIKYNDEHVPESPFSFRISAPPDASKVQVIGPGICHGTIENFESKFLCDTRGAGAGQLTVRIRGPKGNNNREKIYFTPKNKCKKISKNIKYSLFLGVNLFYTIFNVWSYQKNNSKLFLDYF